MEDLKILRMCTECGKTLTLMESCRGDESSETSYLVIRCLYCGGYPVEEIARLDKDQSNLY